MITKDTAIEILIYFMKDLKWELEWSLSHDKTFINREYLGSARGVAICLGEYEDTIQKIKTHVVTFHYEDALQTVNSFLTKLEKKKLFLLTLRF